MAHPKRRLTNIGASRDRRAIKHRLDFRGNRRINSVLHIASVTQQRSQPEASAYLARNVTEGKTRREAP